MFEVGRCIDDVKLRSKRSWSFCKDDVAITLAARVQARLRHIMPSEIEGDRVFG
jgi:hypothetical protein